MRCGKKVDLYNDKQQGYVHSVETGGMVDGPGVRYVIFLSGCALRCKYCHNPDTWKLSNGQLVTVGSTIRDIKKYQSYLKFSGGGVTVTGGDPLMQPEFLTELLIACKANGLHTALDTSGYAAPNAVEKVLKYTDILLLDIKTINPSVHKQLTGVTIDRTLKTLKLSESMGVSVWIRFVLIPGYTDNMEDISQMSKFLDSFNNIEKIEVLPFHKLGEFKWENMGITYELKDVEPPTLELLEQVKAMLKA